MRSTTRSLVSNAGGLVFNSSKITTRDLFQSSPEFFNPPLILTFAWTGTVLDYS